MTNNAGEDGFVEIYADDLPEGVRLGDHVTILGQPPSGGNHVEVTYLLERYDIRRKVYSGKVVMLREIGITG